jgi:hypothetical protein
MLGAMKWIFSQFLSATVLPEVERVSAASTTPSCKTHVTAQQAGSHEELAEAALHHAVEGALNKIQQLLQIHMGGRICDCSKSVKY